MAKRTGISTGGIEQSPRYRRRRARARAAEEQAWTEQNGPVLIRIGEHEIYAKSQAKKDVAAARAALLRIIGGDADESVRPVP